MVRRYQQAQAADAQLVAAVRHAVGIKTVGRRRVVRKRQGKREGRIVAQVKFGRAVGKADGLVRTLDAQRRDEHARRPAGRHDRIRIAVYPGEFEGDINLFDFLGLVVVGDGDGEDRVFVYIVRLIAQIG